MTLTIKLKKAAMFGLDARIALAIFGALSVISGASLYSAIQNAKATAVIADFNEVEKAIEQYYLDTGSIIPQISTTSNLQIQELVDSEVNNWNGPYLNYEKSGTITLTYKDAKNMNIRLGLADSVISSRTSCTDLSNSNCVLWLEVYNIDLSIKKEIDRRIDDGSASNGRVRVCSSCGATGSILYRLSVK